MRCTGDWLQSPTVNIGDMIGTRGMHRVMNKTIHERVCFPVRSRSKKEKKLALVLGTEDNERSEHFDISSRATAVRVRAESRGEQNV